MLSGLSINNSAFWEDMAKPNFKTQVYGILMLNC